MEIKQSTKFNPNEFEDEISKLWEKEKAFEVNLTSSKKKFSIVMPPPNVTGILHMGHALAETLQDIVVRFKRMQGFEVLWVPGTDHAAIATEAKISKQLKDEGIDKKKFGKENFLKRAWQWKEQCQNEINSQIKKLGVSCDWTKQKFTMDSDCCEAVRKFFVDL